MDKQLIAHELWAAAQLAPSEGIEDGISRIAAILARIDAERGKEAVAKVLVHYNYGPGYKASVEWLTDYRLAPDTPLFLSPTIPEGTALVSIEPTGEMLLVMQDAINGGYDDERRLYAAIRGAD